MNAASPNLKLTRLTLSGDKVLLLGLGDHLKDASHYTLLTDELSFEPYAIVLPRGGTLTSPSR